MADLDMVELKKVFLEEAAELVSDMEQALLLLEEQPEDVEALNRVFRCAHSIKGGSGTVGLDQMMVFTHALEALLDTLRRGEKKLDTELFGLLLECRDLLATLIDDAMQGRPAHETGGMVTRIEASIDGQNSDGLDTMDEDSFRAEIERLMAEAESGVVQEPVAAPVTKEVAPEPMQAKAPIRSTASETDSAHADNQILRVPSDKIDKLINLVGELVIHQSFLSDTAESRQDPALSDAVGALARTTRELQERVMAVRMLPIKHVFGRFGRLIRDVSASTGKKLLLKTFGEDTELDKTLIEGLADPITHLIRNSADHGIEPAEQRLALGKPEVGTITLQARQEGGSIVVEVIDDGRGLDRDKIVQKAVRLGVIDAGEQMTDEEAFKLICHPGLSTAEKVTNVSGRGVGMDVVQRGVRTLGGSLSITSTPGTGTCIRIRLPLTLAILEGLSVRVGSEAYILPLMSIVESIRPRLRTPRFDRRP